MTYYPEAAARFTSDTDEHRMTVVLDQGLHRHLSFRAPGTSMYWFDIVTWPGNLVIRGDMGTFAFARIDDMFDFFGAGRDVNPGYWEEKLTTGRDEAKRYDDGLYKRLVTQHVEDHIGDSYPDEAELNVDEIQQQRAEIKALRDAVEEELLGDYADTGHENGAHSALQDFHHNGFEFHDTWEWDLKDWTAQYLWCCHAIRWAISQYRAAKAEAV